MVHGGRDHSRSWDWVAQRLSARWHVIALDLRGHGDSEWSNAGNYMIAGHIYDLVQLIHQQKLEPVTLVAHSLGGSISLRYTGMFPEAVSKIAAIEGLGVRPGSERALLSTVERWHRWVDDIRAMPGYQPRKYPSVDDAVRRMHDANSHLSEEQARHLTVHGIKKNEDGTFSWKFDPYVRPWAPYDMMPDQIAELWERITCPTLLVGGTESWHLTPAEDTRVKHFKNARVEVFEGAGHWVHHDRFEPFMVLLEEFLGT